MAIAVQRWGLQVSRGLIMNINYWLKKVRARQVERFQLDFSCNLVTGPCASVFWLSLLLLAGASLLAKAVPLQEVSCSPFRKLQPGVNSAGWRTVLGPIRKQEKVVMPPGLRATVKHCISTQTVLLLIERDSLTGLMQERALQQQLGESVGHSESQAPVYYLDIEYLKSTGIEILQVRLLRIQDAALVKSARVPLNKKQAAKKKLPECNIFEDRPFSIFNPKSYKEDCSRGLTSEFSR